MTNSTTQNIGPAQLADFPRWASDQLTAPKNGDTVQPKAGNAAAAMSFEDMVEISALPPYVAAAVMGELSRVRNAPHGKRNACLNQAGFALGTFVGGGHLHRQIAEKLLQNSSDSIPDRGDTPEEVKRTIASGLNKGEQQPREIPEEENEEVEPEMPSRPYEPFPVDALTSILRVFVEEVAECVGTDPAFPAVGLLPALAAAIGNTRALKIKDGWIAPSIIWCAVVADSGAKKSPALDPAWAATKEKQNESLRRYAEEKKVYDEAAQIYEKALKVWEKAKEGKPPVKPKEPKPPRFWVGDTTIEALAALLADNWRGMLMARDELSGWLSGFDKYKAAKGGESAQWLECFEGRAVIIDRKTGGVMLSIPRAAVSVSGGIQPRILRKSLTREHKDSGLAARILFAQPPRLNREWNDAGISEITKVRLGGVFEALFALEPAKDERGTLAPVILTLHADAKEAFKSYYNDHGGRIDKAVDDGASDLAAAFSKLEGYAARLALVLHLAKWAENPANTNPGEVDLQSMEAGIRLAQWFCGEAQRLYKALEATEEQLETEILLAFLRRKGGSLTVREVHKNGPTVFQNSPADYTRKALKKLEKRGLGKLETPKKDGGGRTSEVFTLTPKEGEKK